MYKGQKMAYAGRMTEVQLVRDRVHVRLRLEHADAERELRWDVDMLVGGHWAHRSISDSRGCTDTADRRTREQVRRERERVVRRNERDVPVGATAQLSVPVTHGGTPSRERGSAGAAELKHDYGEADKRRAEHGGTCRREDAGREGRDPSGRRRGADLQREDRRRGRRGCRIKGNIL
jgi:hypothetical protein